MVVTVAFTVALPVLLGHPVDHHSATRRSYGPAGGPDALATAGTVIDKFGFIVAATLGATAGTG